MDSGDTDLGLSKDFQKDFTAIIHRERTKARKAARKAQTWSLLWDIALEVEAYRNRVSSGTHQDPWAGEAARLGKSAPTQRGRKRDWARLEMMCEIALHLHHHGIRVKSYIDGPFAEIVRLLFAELGFLDRDYHKLLKDVAKGMQDRRIDPGYIELFGDPFAPK